MTTARPRRLRVGVVGLAHYHVTGWVETLEGFADELEIVALYDPDPERGRTLAPPHHDPSLRSCARRADIATSHSRPTSTT